MTRIAILVVAAMVAPCMCGTGCTAYVPWKVRVTNESCPMGDQPRWTHHRYASPLGLTNGDLAYSILESGHLARAGGPRPTTALLVHGLGGLRSDWQLVARSLAEEFDISVITVDLAGHGDSCLRSDNLGPSCQGKRLVELIEHLHEVRRFERLYLVGTSYGGVSLLEAMRAWHGQSVECGHLLRDESPCATHHDMPCDPPCELGRASEESQASTFPYVRGLILLDVAAYYCDSLVARMCEKTVLNTTLWDAMDQAEHQPWLMAMLGRRHIYTALLDLPVLDESRIPSDAYNEVEYYYSRAPDHLRRRASGMARASLDYLGEMRGRRLRDGESDWLRYSSISAPVLILRGQCSELVPKGLVDALRASLRESVSVEMQVVPDCGHGIALEKPMRAVLAISSFIHRYP